MPVDAKMAIQICSYYCMIFGMGMMIWTDQMAAGYVSSDAIHVQNKVCPTHFFSTSFPQLRY